jgi:hypothetical protein
VKVLKTHFDQVPVETVKELAEPEIVEKEKTVKVGADGSEILKKAKR